MDCERAALDSLARHEVALDIVEDLVRVDVGVVVGRGNRLRVVVEQAGNERTDDESGTVERLVDGRRLVDAAIAIVLLAAGGYATTWFAGRESEEIVPIVDALLRQGVVYYREGSGALSLAYVAAGRLIGYIESHLNSWDGAAGVAIVQAAGGAVNDFLTDDSLLVGAPIIATNEALYPALEAVLPSHLSVTRN